MAGTSKAGVPDPVDMTDKSNHNSLGKVAPVGVARVAEMGDYNPMRKKPNKANVASDTTNTRDTADELVEAKGDRPYRANVEANAETVADTAVVSDAHREGAIKTSAVAAQEPQVHREMLPAEVEGNAPAPASDAGTQS